ncbi:MAG: hypothetical protein AB1454_15155 [Candidatus Auribacterota bacterium]
MIEYCKYRAKLANLFRRKKSLRAAFAEDIRKARKEGKSTEDIQSLEHQSYFEESMIDEEIAILATDYLLEKARRQFVPIPSHDTNGMWKQCNTISNRYVLTNQGISQLRSSLRKNRKEQVEFVVMVLAALTGIIGAVTGLVAVILK